MLLIIDQVATEAKTVKTEIDKQDQLLQEKFQSTYPAINKSIKDEVDYYKDKLLQIKLKKYKRDTEDYLNNHVYHWEHNMQASLPGTAPSTSRATGNDVTRSRLQRNSHMNQDDSSLESDFTFDSDSGPSSSNTAFLQQSRRKPPQRGKEKSGGGGAQQTAGRRPWTRSNPQRR